MRRSFLALASAASSLRRIVRPSRFGVGRMVLLMLVLSLGHGIAQQQTRADDAPGAPSQVSVRITSPLGRTGLGGRVRIVAQIAIPPGIVLSPVGFFVDGVRVGTVDAGPPYAVDWADENPLERREIVVIAADSAGRTVRDSVVLPPFEVTDQTEVTGILLEAGVYDKTGRIVSTLDADAFTVFENEVQQTIDMVTRETLSTDVVLLVDNSQSMSRRMDFVRRATERLTNQLRTKDRVIVAPFNEQVGTITGPTNDPATIAQAIGAMRAGGGTAVLDSLIEGTRLLRNAEGRRAIVLITDGFDENSSAAIDQVLTAVEQTQITVYAVGIGGAAGISLRGEDMLKKIAAVSGGRAYFPPREEDVITVAEYINTDTRSRFLVTYTPLDQRNDGAWRRVSVEVPGDYVVRTRAGYFAPAPPPIRPTIEFTILDEHRRYVDVSIGDIAVFEDGVSQSVDTFQEAVDPVSIVLTLDSSGSMKADAELVKATARDFVRAVRPEDSLAMITFADAPKFAHTFATNRSWTLEAIDKYVPIGGTALYDALWNSLNTLKGVKGRRAIVLLSDGKDENNPGTAPGSTRELSDVLALCKEEGAAIFAVGLGPGVDRQVLETLAEVSGGQAYFAVDAAGLGAEFQRVVGDLRRRYVLGYTSTNSTHDGGWRTVEIRPRASGQLVLAQEGYFAPDR